MPQKKPSYSASDIEILSGLDPVRKRPEMYTNTTDPTHLAHEVIDNSVDEATAGYAKHIQVVLYKDQSLSVQDDGRGMPMDKHPQKKVSGAEVILTTLHAGSKFSSAQYRYAGGLHGVGVSVVNALCARLEANIYRDKKHYCLIFKNGNKAAEKPVKASTSSRPKKGTTIHFTPDPKYFDSTLFNKAELSDLLHTKAVLCPNLKVDFAIEGEGKQSWQYADGIPEYFTQLTQGIEPLLPQPCRFQDEIRDEEFEWCFNWLPNDAPFTSKSYVNLIPTQQGGTHTSGMRNGLTSALREFSELHKLSDSNLKIMPDDVAKGMLYILSIRTPEPRFAGQTKEKFVSKDTGKAIEKAAHDNFSLWLNQNTEDAQKILEQALENARARARRNKRTSKLLQSVSSHLPSKLSDCLSSDIIDNELFLVEGNSAGGSAKQARDRDFQAVMALRGKILNTWESDSEGILASKEVLDIITAIGVAPGSNDLSKLRYGKICMLADADSDGLHISVLLTALFVQHFRAVLEAGHIYVAMPPLFRIDVGNSVYYAHDEKDRDTHMNSLSSKDVDRARIIRFKGLGEMNPKQLRESTMSPMSRRLTQLDDDESTQKMMDMLLAKQRSADRRQWLEEKGNLVEVN